MAVADVVARSSVPGPDVAAHRDAIETTILARGPVAGSDVAAYPSPWGPFSAAAPAEITGTLAVTLADTTLSAGAAPELLGSLAVTLGAATLAAAGTVGGTTGDTGLFSWPMPSRRHNAARGTSRTRR